MFKNYFIVAIRNFMRHQIFSFINIFGLSIGIAISVLIFILIKHEYSFDKFHDNHENIYRVNIELSYSGKDFKIATTPANLAQTLRTEVGGIDNVVRIVKGGYKLVWADSVKFNEDKFFYADAGFFNFFSFKLLRGNPLTVLSSKESIVLTQSTATRYFGETDPIGKKIYLDNALVYTVTGISEDCPPNTHIQYDFMASTIPLGKNFFSDSWLSAPFCTYIKTMQETDLSDLAVTLELLAKKNLAPDLKKHVSVTIDDYERDGNSYSLYLQSIADIHFAQDVDGGYEKPADKQYVYFLAVIAILILIVACINFMNLSTARSSVRAKEVAIRKVVGAHRSQLIRQFLIESIILVTIASALSLVIIEILQPLFVHFTERQINFHYRENLVKIPLILTSIIIVGVFSGSYPALFLSSFAPVKVLRSKLLNGAKSSSSFRSGLVLVQFVVSIVLIIFTFMIYRQINFIQDKKLGFEKEHVVVLRRSIALKRDFAKFKESIQQKLNIKSISNSSDYFDLSNVMQPLHIEGQDKTKLHSLSEINCDTAFITALDLKLLEGSFFNKCIEDNVWQIVLSKKAVEMLGVEDPIGLRLQNPIYAKQWSDKSWPNAYEVVGVVDDFHFESLKEQIKPIMLLGIQANQLQKLLSIKFENNKLEEVVSVLRNEWQKYTDNLPFEFFFLNSKINDYYQEEQRIKKLFTLFSAISLIIASLGLFGLSAFASELKTKEIGIRKALGSSNLAIVYVLTKEFAKWVLIANLFAWPLAYLISNVWLKSFTYHVSINFAYFILSSFIALFIALITITVQALRAADKNPADALLYE